MVSLPVPSTPTTRSERGMSSSPSTCDLVLDNAAVILSALRKISSVSGVPFLSEAATIAVRLVNLIKDVRDNNDAFRTLGIDAGKLVWTIATECERLAQTDKSVPVNVQEYISTLVTNLRSIETFIEAKMLRRKLQKIIAYSSDKQEASRYREVLRTALDAFAIQASIASQEALNHISQSINEHRVDVVFDRIHQTDTMNRLMQQQAEQMEQLRVTMVSRYTEEDRIRDERDYHARVEREQQASQMALRAEQEEQAEEDRLRREQEKKEEETALLRKKAAESLARMDMEEAEKLEAKKRREQAREERETREAIAVVQMHERLEAERLRKEQEEDEREEERRRAQEARRRKKRQEELERQRQQDEEELAAKKEAIAARKEARIAAQEAEDAKEEARRRQQRQAERKRRDEEEEYIKPPRRRPGPGQGAQITATQVEITLTRKNKSSTSKKSQKSSSHKDDTTYTHAEAELEFDSEKFARELESEMEREFEGFEDEFLDSDEQEYWSDDAPRKTRATTKKSIKAAARAGRARSYVDVDALQAGIQDMTMQHVHAYTGAHSPYYPPHHHASPYMMPPPGPYGYNYHPGYAASSSHANATSISVRNVSNSAISFGDSPAVVQNSGNVSVVNISNVGNRY